MQMRRDDMRAPIKQEAQSEQDKQNWNEGWLDDLSTGLTVLLMVLALLAISGMFKG